MSKVLYIKGNAQLEEKSKSLQVGKIFLNEYKGANPEDEIIEIDLYEDNIPMLDKEVFNAWDSLAKGEAFESLSESQKNKIIRLGEIVDQFMEADKYVFVTPLWNFSIPPMVKAYIDAICIAGKTFKYTENGPIGLLKGKKLLNIQASGTKFSETPIENLEHGSNYIKVVSSFVGIEDVSVFHVEGIAQNPDRAEEIFDKAKADVAAVAKNF